MKPAVRFVLVEPQSAGNVGSAARALLNFGFTDLRIVAPGCDPLADDARWMAVGAAAVLEQATICADLDQALQGAGVVVGTSRRVGRHRRPHFDVQELGSLPGDRPGDLALVFGREDRGLSDLELDRCTHLVHIPTSESYPSVNLAQSVLLLAWELARSGIPEPSDDEPLADHRAREAMYAHLEQALRTIGFLKHDSSEVIMRRIRRLLGRAGLSENEVRIVRGIAHQTLWAAGQAGLTGDVDDDGTGGA